MSDTPHVIDSRETLHEQLNTLINAAEHGNVNIEGSYPVETAHDDTCYDIEVTAVVPPRTR